MNVSPPSIRRRLLAALIGTLLLVWLVAVLLVYRAAGHEVEEVFDADLARSAQTLQTLLLHEVEEEQEMAVKLRLVTEELGDDGLARFPTLAGIVRELHDEATGEHLELAQRGSLAVDRDGSGLVLVARYADGSLMLRDRDAANLPPTEPGYADVRLGDELWRVFCLRDPGTGFTVQVGERHAFREELVRYITRDTLMPLLVALPILALLVWIVVGRSLVPLHRVTRRVSERAPNALDPIDEDNAPLEVNSLVQALNALFARMQAALERERQFTADAAHELRTPLAALKTHLQVAKQDRPASQVGGSIDQALRGVDRAVHLVEQLLLLARADADQTRDRAASMVDLRNVAMDGVASLSQLAVEHDIDLGIEAPHAAVTRGDRAALDILLRNLVDNAIRYTPGGGSVTVAVGEDANGAWLSVLDNGPGVPEGERERVFQRFHRGQGEQAAGTTGSGLGLSIVQRIARLHGAALELGAGIDGRGLGVTVRFGPVAVR